MPLTQMNLSEIADLATQVAVHGTLRISEIGSDAMFDLIVGTAILIYEIGPGG